MKKLILISWLGIIIISQVQSQQKPCHDASKPPFTKPEGINYDPETTDASFRDRMDKGFEQLAKTERGRQLLQCAKDKQGGVTIKASTDGFGGGYLEGQGIIVLDKTDPQGIGANHPIRDPKYKDQLPSNCHDTPGDEDDGGADDPCDKEKDLGVVLGHELGHAVGGNGCGEAVDEESGGNNACRNENPVRQQLGMCEREKYYNTQLDCE